MRKFHLIASGFILICAASPAFAQMAPGGAGLGGMGGMGAPGGAASPQPRERTPDIAPPALPGAMQAPVATGPVVHKAQTGDPTTALFAAVNSGDYNAAQDAISRGANLYAENQLGETPLDLSVSLNRSSTPQPRERVPDIAPPALPGAMQAPVATGPVVHKAQTGDPTTALFAAVNSGDYNAAQDAISRGANLYAQNQLGETPLDLSVSLNRSSITFLLLATRNETGGDVASAPPTAPAPSRGPCRARSAAACRGGGR